MPVSLSSLHLSEVRKRDRLPQDGFGAGLGLRTGEGFGGALEAGRTIGRAELLSRVVGLGDRRQNARLKWIGRVVALDDCQAYGGSTVAILAQARRSFEAMILHGDDIRRLQRIVREVRAVFASKPLLVVTGSLTHEARSNLLSCGADGAFGTDEPPGVAAAMLRAIVWRSKLPPATGNERGWRRAPKPARLPDLLPDIHFTRSDRVILQQLEAHANRPVACIRLLRALGRRVDDSAVRSLQVGICLLRRKLPPGIRITNHRDDGYCLNWPDPALQAAALPLS